MASGNHPRQRHISALPVAQVSASLLRVFIPSLQQQAPMPAREPGTVLPPPSPQSTSPPSPQKIANQEIAGKVMETESDVSPQARHCYQSYVEYHKCTKEKGRNAPQCDNFARHYRSLCPDEWISKNSIFSFLNLRF
ncbi:putative cytochrome c oxidase subunit 6b-like [Herrania umbratica]|uniref:Cytochrome c oxidase subunit 6b-like n=1 Tax=Herrania umbratica TaxID=108875 RepID=A0A6J1B307_9ROSI|nr:putative cytochrome c oxidase subunit 6b-like [Herrania umbratica]